MSAFIMSARNRNHSACAFYVLEDTTSCYKAFRHDSGLERCSASRRPPSNFICAWHVHRGSEHCVSVQVLETGSRPRKGFMRRCSSYEASNRQAGSTG